MMEVIVIDGVEWKLEVYGFHPGAEALAFLDDTSDAGDADQVDKRIARIVSVRLGNDRRNILRVAVCAEVRRLFIPRPLSQTEMAEFLHVLASADDARRALGIAPP